jgi:hypothetical protein
MLEISYPDLPLVSVSWINHFVDPFDQNVALWRDKCTEEANKVGHGLVDCAPEYPRVEIASRPGNGDFIIGKPSEAVSQSWSPGVEPIVVGLPQFSE